MTTAPTIALYDALDAGTLRGMVGVGPDYTQVGAVFELAKLPIAFFANGGKITDAEARKRLATLPLLYWSPQFFNTAAHGINPYSAEYLAWFRDKVVEAMKRLGFPDVRHICDFENPGPFKPSPFNERLPDGKVVVDTTKGWEIPSNVPHLATMTHTLHAELCRCTSGPVRLVNYHTSHAAVCPDLGVAPFWRMSPHHVPAIGDGFTLLSTYDKPGPCTDAEYDHALEMAPRPFGIVLRLDDPKIVARVKQARLSGAELVLLFGGISASGKWTTITPKLAREIAGNWTGGDIAVKRRATRTRKA